LFVAENLLALVAHVRPIAAKLRALGRDRVVFDHVDEAAQAFVAALVATQARTAKKARRVWIVAATLRSQEQMHNELANWLNDAIFLPEMESVLAENALPDPETAADRLQALEQVMASKSSLVVLSAASLDDQVPTPGGITRLTLELERGQTLALDALISKLGEAGYERVPQVALRGQFAVRGGIVDLFSWQHTLPVRIEFFGDVIDSMRFFDLDVQTSVQPVDAVSVLLGEASAARQCALRDYIKPGDLVVDVQAGLEQADVAITADAAPGAEIEDFSTAFYPHGLGEFEAGDLVVEAGKRERFLRQLGAWLEQGWRVTIYCNNEGETERFRDLLPEPILTNAGLELVVGAIAHGFTFPEAKLALLSDAELFGRYRNTRARRLAMRRAREQANRAQIDFSELTEGDYVVHLEHGIALYLGLEKFAKADGTEEEVLLLEFAHGAKLYAPLEQSYLVSRYVGVGKRNPQLSELGDPKWAKAKSQAQKAVFDYAGKLLSVHAERETAVGFAFPPDSKWLNEFERSFVFKETPDQVTAIAATKTDMESERPMDRLICGDVGFGKTEVAIRAAFKAVMGGKQVALLVPTTVLAQQHYQNFRERMSDYPVTVECLSRFRTQGEQRKVVEGLKDGSVDIVIGTHRLISRDVQFKNLGLVVIDEEQRFGVLHKEKFKELFKLVDVLTLSATPIPRTLYLSLMGAKDMSILETPPQNRIPTETFICGYDERIIRDAIVREMARQGQVYFLHNRVGTIESMAAKLKKLIPKARILVGHGQMPEHELEEVMRKFVEGEADVLLSTTIIESGLDIPNANTIIIDRADRFGLADLYQLRGRVGRAQHKAYAYLMIPRDLMRTEARKRINAIKQYSSLGAGFKIAMRDLEIRGAGNILGTQQSGHIVAIGFDLYCQLLKQAVAKLKGEKVSARVELPVSLDFLATNEAEWLKMPEAAAPAFLPTTYISEAQTRIQAYRALAEVTSQDQLDRLRGVWRDRFGRLPEAVENLLTLGSVRLTAAARKVTRLEVRERKLMLTRNADYVLIGGKFPRLTAAAPAERLREMLTLLRKF
jgi:transcription-repair coupling factor (superfamily II helicase)